MKTVSFLLALFCISFVCAQAVPTPSLNFSKSSTITLQGNIGVSYLPDGDGGKIAYGLTGL